jgi:hypothetical protein
MIIQKISQITRRRVQTKEIDNLTVRYGATHCGTAYSVTMSNDDIEVKITREEYEKLRDWFEEK